MILADKLIHFVSENLLRNLNQMKGSQPILLRSSKLELRGENCGMTERSESKEFKSQKKYYLRLKSIRGISSTVKTETPTVRPFFHPSFTGRESLFRNTCSIQISNSSKLAPKPSIYSDSFECSIAIVPNKFRHYI
jgi:hypothetical protein